MFTGLVEQLGTIHSISKSGTNITFQVVQDAILPALQIDESVSHNGICLTVESISTNYYTVTAIAETVAKTTIGNWKEGDIVNIERAIRLSDRLGGHIVQGHIDGVGICTDIQTQDGSTLFTFSYPESFAKLIIEKGSICVNGTSLTAFNISKNEFSVAIIPFTLEHTIFKYLAVKDAVNLEFDILGKYILRDLELKM